MGMSENNAKAAARDHLRERPRRRSARPSGTQKSSAACGFVAASPEFAAASVVMLFLSMPHEVDTAPLALRCWQAGKTVVVPKVSWDQRRMLPVEITSLQTGMTTTGPGVREPATGQADPDRPDRPRHRPRPRLHRHGLPHRPRHGLLRPLPRPERVRRPLLRPGVRGADRSTNCPCLTTTCPLSMLVTDRGIRRFASNCIQTE